MRPNGNLPRERRLKIVGSSCPATFPAALPRGDVQAPRCMLGISTKAAGLIDLLLKEGKICSRKRER